MKKIMTLSLLLGAIVLTGCTNTTSNIKSYPINKDEYIATSFNHRIRYVILHYTATDREKSIRTLTTSRVSSHYLVTDEKKDPIYQLVDLDKRAWHAGVSEFGGRKNLNDTSIGIEIVNKGYKRITTNVDLNDPIKNIKTRKYYPYTKDQIKKIAYLLDTLIKKYNIEPQNILGHSDVSPTRKQDPGPLFPWEELYKTYGLGAWYDEDDFRLYNNKRVYEKYSVGDIQKELRKYGYNINITGKINDETIKVIGAFQGHFRPDKVTGEMDLETFAILKALNKKYK